jgi:cytochrome b
MSSADRSAGRARFIGQDPARLESRPDDQGRAWSANDDMRRLCARRVTAQTRAMRGRRRLFARRRAAGGARDQEAGSSIATRMLVTIAPPRPGSRIEAGAFLSIGQAPSLRDIPYILARSLSLPSDRRHWGKAEAMATTHAPLQSARIRVWDLPLRLFHWLLVIAIALAFLSSEEDSLLNQWHILAGWIAGLLVVFRIAWGFVGGEHSRFANFVRPSGIGRHFGELLRGRPEPTLGHNALGALSVLLLLAMVAATVGTGVILMEELHELIAWTLLALVAVHVAAVVLMSLLTRESLVTAMISGTKPAQRHPGARDARRQSMAGLIVAALVVAATIYAIRAYDPLAFTLRSAEDYEHGVAGGQDDRSGGEDEEVHGRGDDER